MIAGPASVTTPPLTASAERLLYAAALLRGEPDNPFTVAELVEFENSGSAGYQPTAERGEARHVRGVLANTLPALVRRDYVRPVGGRYVVTEAGFEHAVEQFGRGLL